MVSEGQSCPSPEVLGGFVEGRLSPARRAEVQQHLVTCTECLFVVRETAHILGSGDDEEVEEAETEPHPVWRSAAVAAGLILVVTLAAWMLPARDPLAPLKTAVAGQPTRSVKGRLSDFPHARYEALRTGAPAAVDPRVTAEAERLRAFAGNDAPTLHARGIGALLGGEPNDAVPLLASAARSSPDEARYWSDLAAAQLQAGDAAGARESAARALDVDPALAAAHFNLAQALQDLGRVGDARAAWADYLLLDPSSPWSDEARLALRELSR